jgi:hypothetical protein
MKLSFTTDEALRNWLSLTLAGRAILMEVVPIWLLSTKAGRAILDEIMPGYILDETPALETELRSEVERRLCGRAAVLVVCHGDGFLEAYSKDAQVHFATMLDTSAEVLAEEYMETQLPLLWRSIFLPRNRVAVHLAQRQTAEAEIERRNDIATLRELEKLVARIGPSAKGTLPPVPDPTRYDGI